MKVNKKAQTELGFGTLPIIALVFGFLIMIIALATFIYYDEYQFPKEAEEKCEKLDMEVFDHSSGGLFTDSSITCWNPETKETRVIK